MGNLKGKSDAMKEADQRRAKATDEIGVAFDEEMGAIGPVKASSDSLLDFSSEFLEFKSGGK